MRMQELAADGGIVDPREAAKAAGLSYVGDGSPGIRRRRSGKGFAYRGPDGRAIRDRETLRRIRALAVPPAWTDVWICPRPHGHIQATGRDARGRKQYRYHPEFREIRDGTKYEHLTAFAATLPRIRAAIAEHMRLPRLPREKVLATVVHLLETTLIRVGNADYARQNKSYGLTTLRDPHVRINGSELRFHFKAKSGQTWRLQLKDRRVARIVRGCQELPGQQLFQYLDAEGQPQAVTSSDVNAYLHEISGCDITAKDFRTWAGTVLAALALQEFGGIDSRAMAKRNIRAAIERVALRLGNTVTICRKCYVHPDIVNSYLAGELLLEVKTEIDRELSDDFTGLRPEEAAVLALLEGRLRRELDPAEKGRKDERASGHR
jgi:DNA topoisomerase I